MTKKTTALAKRGATDLAPLIADDLEYAAVLAASDTADATRVAYTNDFKYWTEYAEERELPVFPIGAGSLAAYIGHLAKSGYKVSTIRRRCAAIAYYHNTVKGDDGEYHVSPTGHRTIRKLLHGLTREHGAAPDKKTALTVDLVRQIVENLDAEMAQTYSPKKEQRVRRAALRDKAIILVGLMTGMRRSELEYLEWGHFNFTQEGVTIFIPMSKTDKNKEGQFTSLPQLDGVTVCPIVALREWEEYLDNNGEDSAYVFDCSGSTINRMVQRRLAAIIGDESVDYGAHSFRSGHVTEAHKAGGRLEDIMAQTRHKSRQVAQGYIQHTELLRNPSTLGLLKRLQPGVLDG